MVNQAVVIPAETATASLGTDVTGAEDADLTTSLKVVATDNANTQHSTSVSLLSDNCFKLEDKVLISLVSCIPAEAATTRIRPNNNLNRDSVPPRTHIAVQKPVKETRKDTHKQKETKSDRDKAKFNADTDAVSTRTGRNSAKQDDDGFEKGGALEVYDLSGKAWYRTRILEVNRDCRPPTVRVHFLGFSKIFDEDISFYSARLRPAGSGAVQSAVIDTDATKTHSRTRDEVHEAGAGTKAELHDKNSTSAPVRSRKRTISNTSTNDNLEVNSRARKQTISTEPDRKPKGVKGSSKLSNRSYMLPSHSGAMSRFLYNRKRTRERSNDFDFARNARKRSVSNSSAASSKSRLSTNMGRHDSANGHSEGSVGNKRPRRTGEGSAALKSLFSYGRNMGDVKIDLDTVEAGEMEQDDVADEGRELRRKKGKDVKDGKAHSEPGHQAQRAQGKDAARVKSGQRLTGHCEGSGGGVDGVTRPVRERRTGNGSSALNSLFSYGPTMGDVVIDFAALEDEEEKAEEKSEKQTRRKMTRRGIGSNKSDDDGSGSESADTQQRAGRRSGRNGQGAKSTQDSRSKVRDHTGRQTEEKARKDSAQHRRHDSNSASTAASDSAPERARVRSRRTGDGRAALKSLFSSGPTMGDVILDTALLDDTDGSQATDESDSDDNVKEQNSGKQKGHSKNKSKSSKSRQGESSSVPRSTRSRSQHGKPDEDQQSSNRSRRSKNTSEIGHDSKNGVKNQRRTHKQDSEKRDRNGLKGRNETSSVAANDANKESGAMPERVQPKRGSLGDDAKNSLFVDHPPWWEETVTLETGYDLSAEEVGDESEDESDSETSEEEGEDNDAVKGDRRRTTRSTSTASLARGRTDSRSRTRNISNIQARSRAKAGTDAGGKARTRTQSEATSTGASKSAYHSRTRTKSAGETVNLDSEDDSELNTKRSERPKRGLLGDEAKNALFIDHPPWYEETITLDTIDKLGGLDAFSAESGSDENGGESNTEDDELEHDRKSTARKSTPHESDGDLEGGDASACGSETDSETESDEDRPGREKRVDDSNTCSRDVEGAVSASKAEAESQGARCSAGARGDRKQTDEDRTSQASGSVSVAAVANGDADNIKDAKMDNAPRPKQMQGADAGEGAPLDTRVPVQVAAVASAVAERTAPYDAKQIDDENWDGDDRARQEQSGIKATHPVGDEPPSPVGLNVNGHASEVEVKAEGGSERRADAVIGIDDMDLDVNTITSDTTGADSNARERSDAASVRDNETDISNKSNAVANPDMMDVSRNTGSVDIPESVSKTRDGTSADGSVGVSATSDTIANSDEKLRIEIRTQSVQTAENKNSGPSDGSQVPAGDSTTSTNLTTTATNLSAHASGSAADDDGDASDGDDTATEDDPLDGTLASVNLTSHKRNHWTPLDLAQAMQQQHAGSHVFARWVDGVFYPVRIVGGCMNESDPVSVDVLVKAPKDKTVPVAHELINGDRGSGAGEAAAKDDGDNTKNSLENKLGEGLSAGSTVETGGVQQAINTTTHSETNVRGREVSKKPEKITSATEVRGWLYYDVDFRPITDSAEDSQAPQHSGLDNLSPSSEGSRESAPQPSQKLPSSDINSSAKSGSDTGVSTSLNTLHVKRVPWSGIIVPDAALEAKVSENTRRDTRRGLKRARALQRNKDGSLDGRTAAARALKMSKLGKGVNVGTYRAGSKHAKAGSLNVHTRGDVDASAVATANVIGDTNEGRTMRKRRNTTVSVSESNDAVAGHTRHSADTTQALPGATVNTEDSSSVSVGGVRRPVRERRGGSASAVRRAKQPRAITQPSVSGSEQEVGVSTVGVTGVTSVKGKDNPIGTTVKPQTTRVDSARKRSKREVVSQGTTVISKVTKRPLRVRGQGKKIPNGLAAKEVSVDVSATTPAVAPTAKQSVLRGLRVSRSISESSTTRASREHSDGKHTPANAQSNAKAATDASTKGDGTSTGSSVGANLGGVGVASTEVIIGDKRVSGKAGVLPHLPVLMTSRGKIDGRSSAARGASMIARVSAMNGRGTGRGARTGTQRSRQLRNTQQSAKHTSADSQVGASAGTNASLAQTRHRHSSVSSQGSASGKHELASVRHRYCKDLGAGTSASGTIDTSRKDAPLNMRRTKSEAMGINQDKVDAGGGGAHGTNDIEGSLSATTSRKSSIHRPVVVMRHVRCMCGGITLVGRGWQCHKCKFWLHDTCVQLSMHSRQSGVGRATASKENDSAQASSFTCFRCKREPNPLFSRVNEIFTENRLPTVVPAEVLRGQISESSRNSGNAHASNREAFRDLYKEERNASIPPTRFENFPVVVNDMVNKHTPSSGNLHSSSCKPAMQPSSNTASAKSAQACTSLDHTANLEASVSGLKPTASNPLLTSQTDRALTSRYPPGNHHTATDSANIGCDDGGRSYGDTTQPSLLAATSSNPGKSTVHGTDDDISTASAEVHALSATKKRQDNVTAACVAHNRGVPVAGQLLSGGVHAQCVDLTGSQGLAGCLESESGQGVRAPTKMPVTKNPPSEEAVIAYTCSRNTVESCSTTEPRSLAATVEPQDRSAATMSLHTGTAVSAPSTKLGHGNLESFSSSLSPPLPLSPTPTSLPRQSSELSLSTLSGVDPSVGDVTMQVNALENQAVSYKQTKHRISANASSGKLIGVDERAGGGKPADTEARLSDPCGVVSERVSTWDRYRSARTRLLPVSLAVSACAHQLSRCSGAIGSPPDSIDKRPQASGSFASGPRVQVAQTEPLLSSARIIETQVIPQRNALLPSSKQSLADFARLLEQIENWQEALLQSIETTRGLSASI